MVSDQCASIQKAGVAVMDCGKQHSGMLIDLPAQWRSQLTPVKFMKCFFLGRHATDACWRATVSQGVEQHLPFPQAHQWVRWHWG